MPLPGDFWDDEQAVASSWTEADLPMKVHPTTLSWTFINFDDFGIHVAVTSKRRPHGPLLRNMESVCHLADGDGRWTESWTNCSSCWGWLKMVKDHQARHLLPDEDAKGSTNQP